MFKKLLLSLFVFVSLGFCEVLNLDEAFDIKHQTDSNGIEFKFGLGKDIYIYKDTFNVKLGDTSILNMLNMPKPTNSKGYQIFMQDFKIFVPINLVKEYLKNGINELNLEYQGCSENGICYRPQFKKYHITETFGALKLQELIIKDEADEVALDEISQEQSIANSLVSSSFIASLATFFGFGLLLSLTPCVFPMIPILSSIIVSKGNNLNVKSGFLLSAVYVFAMSLAYAIAGMIASVAGGGIQAALQNLYVLGIFSLVFIALALSMFGFYEIKLPSKFETMINKKTGSQSGYVGVFIMGFTSALIVSPCVAAPLAGALLYISQSGNLLYGGAMLFVMGLGMGVPLLIVGASSGKLLPKPGIWMDTIKNSFGFLMILMAVWVLSRILGSTFEFIGYGVVGVFWAVFLGAFETAEKGILKIKKSIAILMFIYSVMLIVGGFIGSKDILSPLNGLNLNQTQQDKITFKKVNTLDELNDIIQTSSKPILVDFWASWCVSCLELDNKTFSDKSVIQELDKFTLIKIDVTKSNNENRKILNNFSLINPPALLFFNSGRELTQKRVIGYISPENLLKKIDDI